MKALPRRCQECPSSPDASCRVEDLLGLLAFAFTSVVSALEPGDSCNWSCSLQALCSQVTEDPRISQAQEPSGCQSGQSHLASETQRGKDFPGTSRMAAELGQAPTPLAPLVSLHDPRWPGHIQVKDLL